tara:strand:+ start:156 stop:554 length:399 start_codon:yes stop_codon:yes gene_type:complete
MNSLIFIIIGIPIIEIYLFIKIGAKIGAVSTILLIISTALIGLIYVRYEGFNTLRSAMSQLIKNEIPIFEIISGAALVIGAFLLLIPGFLTDTLGFLLIFPITRKIIFKKVSTKYKEKNKYIDGDYKDLDEK